MWFAQLEDTLLEATEDCLPCGAKTVDFHAISSPGSDINHLFERGVLKCLKWLKYNEYWCCVWCSVNKYVPGQFGLATRGLHC